jgi:hypothetical protein
VTKPEGHEITPAMDGLWPDPEGGAWLKTIAERIQPKDGYIGALRCAGSGTGEWRLVAYIGDTWDNAGDGWIPLPTTGDDPVSRRDVTTVEVLWGKAIVDSRKEHELRKLAR